MTEQQTHESAQTEGKHQPPPSTDGSSGPIGSGAQDHGQGGTANACQQSGPIQKGKGNKRGKANAAGNGMQGPVEVSNTIEEAIAYWNGDDDIPKRLEDTKKTLKEVVGFTDSFDVIFREMTFGGRRVGLFYLNGFAKDEVMTIILTRLTFLDKKSLTPNALKAFFDCYIPHIQVEKVDKFSEVINKVLAGGSAFFIEHESEAIVTDVKTFPSRGPEEPSLEKVVRGARDGFTETLLTNVTLVRRRLRDPGLKYEIIQVGRRTRTDVCIAYIDDIVDMTQVEAVRKKIKAANLEGLPLADKQLEEVIINKGWNPYPLVRYSERPDVVAAQLLDGNVVIFVDTSPSVMILPTTFFDLCQHAEENRQTPFMGTYMRWIRFIGIFASLFLLPLWMLMVIEPGIKPPALQIIGPHTMAKLPIFLQFLLAEIGIDLMRMAAVHTPSPLAIALGLVAAVMVGEIAVKTGVFVNEVILYLAVTAVGMFATPSYELSLANRVVRLLLLVAVALFKVPGLVIGITLFILWLSLNRSYNSSYLWPFIPFNAKAMFNILFRQPVLNMKTRPSFNKTRDSTKMPPDPSSDPNNGELQT
ncbi:spore germination protein [Paenibacillus dendritiformis]|uniref:Gera spore germination protein n=1 Tax=Paenibacillus dendritiformis C454 TaxID=1131935 RepID=H3SFK2_9BACL|nr:spore germination protein [Paenibacillus dendritiformis]EHQ62231.1 gera spore germination protein [Paenibacillus dendritiformis C454]CAH8771519.1 spore germination protein [Paenibacillus dendritiformis]